MRCQYCGRYFPFQKKDVIGHIVIVKTKEGFWTEVKMSFGDIFYTIERIRHQLNLSIDIKEVIKDEH